MSQSAESWEERRYALGPIVEVGDALTGMGREPGDGVDYTGSESRGTDHVSSTSDLHPHGEKT